MVILDSTVLVDFLRRKPNAIEKIKELEENGIPLHTTQINVYELVFGIFAFSNKRDQELAILNGLLHRMEVLDITFLVAYSAGKTAGELSNKGIQINITDALIASAALANNISIILTQNTKDFSKIPHIRTESY